jgi:hypothetical protein
MTLRLRGYVGSAGLAHAMAGRPERAAQRLGEGSVALSRCTTAHPFYTRFINIFGPSISETTMRPNPRLGAALRGGAGRVRSHCHFRNEGTEYVSESGIKWMSSGAKRQCDRALGAGPELHMYLAVALETTDSPALAVPCLCLSASISLITWRAVWRVVRVWEIPRSKADLP